MSDTHIIIGGRQTGKTTKLIERAVDLGATIVMPNARACAWVWHRVDAYYAKNNIDTPRTPKSVPFASLANGNTAGVFVFDDIGACISCAFGCGVDCISIESHENSIEILKPTPKPMAHIVTKATNYE